MMNNYFKNNLYLLVICLFLACEEDVIPVFSIQTEEIVNVSGERAIVTGRIIAFENILLEDHGFYFSKEENFSQPIILSLGETSKQGRFVGETNGLELGVGYFVKAFVIRNGETIFGNVLPFETLDSAVDRFLPGTQFPGEDIIIYGRNFGDDTEVFFGGRKAEVREVSFGFQVRVRVPPMAGNVTEDLRIVTRGVELVLDEPFRYATGIYEQLNPVIEDFVLVDNIYFQQGNRFFVGLGMDITTLPANFIWEYSPGQTAWQRTSFEGLVHRKATSSRTGFFGGGIQEPKFGGDELNNDFWSYDGTSFNRIESPPVPIVDGLGFIALEKFYIAGGTLGVGSQVYRYDSVTQRWELRSTLPYNVDKSMVHFIHNDQLFHINKNKIVHRYNLETGSSTVISEYPGRFIEKFSDTGGISVVVGDIVYIGLYDNNEEMWEFDLRTFIWSKKNLYPGPQRGKIAAVFESEGILYFLRTYTTPRRMEFWKFDPDGY